jgi:hypothetical protein
LAAIPLTVIAVPGCTVLPSYLKYPCLKIQAGCGAGNEAPPGGSRPAILQLEKLGKRGVVAQHAWQELRPVHPNRELCN